MPILECELSARTDPSRPTAIGQAGSSTREKLSQMISDLTISQLELHDLMSSMSEQAWSSGWMRGLEYELWRAVQSPAYKVGRLQLSPTQCDRLRQLSEKCGGWIAFDDQHEESFVPRAQWLTRYEDWSSSR